ncbi:MAG: hypothetical protein ACO28V_04930 [Chitinophagaceae bacterium]
MKKPQTFYAIGLFLVAFVLIEGLMLLPKSWSQRQLNQVNSPDMVEKTEKISAGMPLWHAIPRFLFRRY